MATLAVVWVPGQVKKLPLNIDQTTHLSGDVKKIDLSTGELVANPVNVESISKVDSKRSDDTVAVWTNTSCAVINTDNPPGCVDGDDPRLISADTDVFATDRVTAEAVPNYKGLPDGATPHEGLVNKWPFDSQKKDYTYWDGTIGKAVPVTYEGTDKLQGVDVYIYKYDIEAAPIEIAEGTPGTYTNKGEIWVEPVTGAVQQQTQDQQRYLADGTQVLDLQIGFTPAQLKQSAQDAKDNLAQLNLLLFWVPLVGFIAGAICLIAGILMALAARRAANGDGASHREMADAAS